MVEDGAERRPDRNAAQHVSQSPQREPVAHAVDHVDAVADPFEGKGRENHPVVLVDWWDAYAFASWIGRRLPTEDEWERAARHTDGRKFPWGNGKVQEGDVVRANARFVRGRKLSLMTTTVGAFPEGAAPCGALDLAGNAWEWTASVFAPFDGFAPDVYADYSAPWFGSRRVLLGGSWMTSPDFARPTTRNFFEPHRRDPVVGFRTCAAASG